MAEGNQLSLLEARQRYFASLGSSGIDYEAWWIDLPLYGVQVPMLNPPAHGHALRVHDLHHVLTGYDTSIIGECEISAWELAGGSGAYVAAIGFDLAGTGLGLLFAPHRTLLAFARGRRSKNLFRKRYSHALLSRSVEDVRRELGITAAPEPTLGDMLRFAFWASFGLWSLLLWPLSWLFIAVTCCAPAPRHRAAEPRGEGAAVPSG